MCSQTETTDAGADVRLSRMADLQGVTLNVDEAEIRVEAPNALTVAETMVLIDPLHDAFGEASA